jgi:hypothetical protein
MINNEYIKIEDRRPEIFMMMINFLKNEFEILKIYNPIIKK